MTKKVKKEEAKTKEPKLIEVENGKIIFTTTNWRYTHLFTNIKG